MSLTRRDALLGLAATAATAACTRTESPASSASRPVMDPIIRVVPLGFPWQTIDPFLFCAYHDDHYPAGDVNLGPAVPLDGRDLGQDFAGKDGWRMYHGLLVPGFPQHPHRGFETVTVVRRGMLDHSDSLGGAGRYGGGDVQWMTAGKGVLHAEMFPLLNRDQPNPLELFQIWLNLPASDKFAEPHYQMQWSEAIPRKVVEQQGRAEVVVVAGSLGDIRAAAPPPHSWAARPDSDVAIWTIKLAPGTRWTLPAAKAGTNRALYFFAGGGLQVAGREVPPSRMLELRPEVEVALATGSQECELLLLQGRPIGEPVVAQGPFVMNTRAEIAQAFADYRRTQFGGWSWPSDDPVHPREEGRFARHSDGRVERPG